MKISAIVDNPAVLPTDVIPTSKGDASVTVKTEVADLADTIADSIQYSNLQTTSKTLVGAINEAAQSGGGGIDYSTTEQDTGQKWINGKKLYQKVIDYDIATLGLPSGTIIDTGVQDADFMFIKSKVAVFPAGGAVGTFSGENIDGYKLNLFVTTDFKIKSSSGSSNFDPGAGRKLYIIIEYTKAS